MTSMEKRTMKVTILGQVCKVVVNTPEDEARLAKTTQLLQQEVDEMLGHPGISQLTAAVYAAMNIGDRLCREQDAMENLRQQITQSAERATKLEKELQKLKQENKQEKKAKASRKGKEDLLEDVTLSFPEEVLDTIVKMNVQEEVDPNQTKLPDC